MQAEGSHATAGEPVASVRPLQFRGRSLTAVALHLTGGVDDAFLASLDARLRQTPLFFENAPLVIDLAEAAGLDSAAEMERLTTALRNRRLSVFGVQNARADQGKAAVAAGLIVLPAGRDVALERAAQPAARPGRSRAAAPEPVPEPVAKEPQTRLITQPVRSGQTVFADRGDLVIVGPVGSGAEVIATGNIHIYGRLRGRALAGVNGDTSARIFCHALDAELLAIAGLYRTSETLGPDIPRDFVQVYLEGEKLCVAPLK
ncbi:septum site-determining protein MinC [Paracoccus aestuariivivens]|uniref:Probable septum site-determining protein MinC n=1 Tax=Paracoccus aestuariivivens TaxID=1820333 RepID=A0A6L6J4Y3_9RHOB|nr:septum formation inhibitor MinC [Paracoccus aestuariivivens]